MQGSRDHWFEEAEGGTCSLGWVTLRTRRFLGAKASGRPGWAISQQGLATTCKDPLTEALTVGGGRDLVWRMSPYER